MQENLWGLVLSGQAWVGVFDLKEDISGGLFFPWTCFVELFKSRKKRKREKKIEGTIRQVSLVTAQYVD